MEVKVPPPSSIHPYPIHFKTLVKKDEKKDQALCHPHTCFLLDRKGG